MNTLTENISQYVELQKQKVLLNLAEKTSRLVADVSVKLVFLLLAVIALLLLSFGLAILINIWLMSSVWGFFIMAALLGGSAVVFLYRGKAKVTEIIVDDLLDLLYEDDESEK